MEQSNWWYRGGTFILCADKNCKYKNLKVSKVRRHWRRTHAK